MYRKKPCLFNVELFELPLDKGELALLAFTASGKPRADDDTHKSSKCWHADLDGPPHKLSGSCCHLTSGAPITACWGEF